MPTASIAPPQALAALVLIGLFFILPSYFVAKFAEHRGRGFWNWFTLAIVFSWFVALLVVVLLPPVTTVPADSARAESA
jgi:hypothetical protein